jgi:hypothetical protein
MALQLRGPEGAMHMATLRPQTLQNMQMHADKEHKKHARSCSCLALLGITRCSLKSTALAGLTARLQPRSVRALARVSNDEDSDEDLIDWEEDDDGLEVEEFENVTITTAVEDDG